MKNSGSGFALGLFGTIAMGSEFRIFGGFTFVTIAILIGVFAGVILLKRALESGSDSERIAFRDRSYDWNAAQHPDHHGLGCPRT